MGRTDLSKIKRIHPDLNLGPDDFPDLGPGGVENPTLSDGEHVILSCFNCEAPLADIWITHPEEILTSKVKAKCDHCGKASFVKTVKGRFHLGSTDYSTVSNIESENMEMLEGILISQQIIIHTGKIKAYGN